MRDEQIGAVRTIEGATRRTVALAALAQPLGVAVFHLDRRHAFEIRFQSAFKGQTRRGKRRRWIARRALGHDRR